MTPVPLLPRYPERVCWGRDKYCPADDLACGNGTIRTLHPVELFGDDWLEWSARAPSQRHVQRYHDDEPDHARERCGVGVSLGL